MFKNFNYKICILDTCAISALLKPHEHDIAQGIISKLLDNYCFAILDSCYSELTRANRLLEKFPKFFYALNFLMFKGYDSILSAELKKYPDEISFEDCIYPEFIGLSFDELFETFHQKPLLQISHELTSNDQEQACTQLNNYIQQFGNQNHQIFVVNFVKFHLNKNEEKWTEAFRNDKKNGLMNISSKIKTMYTMANFIFYKFVKPNKKVKDSDPLDLLNISCLPYCDMFITESNNAEILRQMKKTTPLISHVEILAFRDFRSK